MKLLRLLILPALALLASIGTAQTKLILHFDSADQREIWIQTGLPAAPPATSIQSDETSVEVPAQSAKPTDAVFVWDKKTGNLASATVKSAISASGWNLTAATYTDIAEVDVNVQSDGKPAAAANVSLDDGRRTQTMLLDPSASGRASFFAVKPGALKIKVEYRSNGKPAPPVVQLLNAPLSRPDATPTITVALPLPTATTSAPSSEPAAPPSASSEKQLAHPPDQSGSPIGAIIGYLAALAVAVGIGYLIFKYFKDNPDTVASKLEQLGAQIPKPGDDALTNATPIVPTPVQPQPIQKIILDDSDPASAPNAAPSISPTPLGQPRLIDANGDALPLQDGTLTVGREIGLGLSLVGESTVSRHHAEVRKAGSQVTVADLGSTNGTYVNGAKIAGEAPLKPGDSVQFGSVKFRYEG